MTSVIAAAMHLMLTLSTLEVAKRCQTKEIHRLYQLLKGIGPASQLSEDMCQVRAKRFWAGRRLHRLHPLANELQSHQTSKLYPC